MIYGLTGYAGAGKDTAAEALIEEGFTRVAFADALRDMLYALNPLVGQGDLRVADIALMKGWTRAKAEHPEIRELLQRLGTEAGRKILGESIWIDTAMAKLLDPSKNYVVTDVRFPNEADAIRAMGGQIVRIVRPGTGAVNAHPSETAMDDYEEDWLVENDESVPYLHRQMRHLL